MALRILITGSRNWADHEKVRAAIIEAGQRAEVHPQETWIVHGGARGADTIAAEIGRGFGCHVEEHRADWERYGKSAGHRRNADMVALGADVCLAFPLGASGESRGTRACMRLAEKAGIPVLNYGDPT